MTSGPNLPFQRDGNHRVGFLARGQAALRLKTRYSTKRHHVLLTGLNGKDQQPITALLRIKTLTEAPSEWIGWREAAPLQQGSDVLGVGGGDRAS